MQLDVIIPTYNCQHLLQRTLRNLRDAIVPADLAVRVTVVDNNSADETRQAVAQWARRHPDNPHPFEKRQGRSSALNADIATCSELIGMSDDEEVDKHWFTIIARGFCSGDVDFISERPWPTSSENEAHRA